MPHEQGRRPGVITRVVSWLRAGYPEGVPTGDYVALLGVLRRRLREEEITEIVERLAAQRSMDVTTEDVSEGIRDFSLQDPLEEDVIRVSALLAAAGYPVDGDLPLDEDEDEDEDAADAADGAAGDSVPDSAADEQDATP